MSCLIVASAGVAAIAAAPVVGLTGCEKAGAKTRTVKLDPPAVTVRVLDAGAAPRRALRFHYRVGAAATFERTSRVVDHVVRDGAATDYPRPREVYRSDSRVVEVDGRGVHTQGRITDVELRAAPGDAPMTGYERKILGMRGAVMDSWSDDRGRNVRPTEVVIDADADVDDLLGRSILDQMIFPDDDLGVGARWELRGTTARETATVTATLVADHGDRVEVRTDFDATYAFSGQTMHVTGHTDWQLDLAGPMTALHLVGHGELVGRAGVSRDLEADYAPLPPGAK